MKRQKVDKNIVEENDVSHFVTIIWRTQLKVQERQIWTYLDVQSDEDRQVAKRNIFKELDRNAK